MTYSDIITNEIFQNMIDFALDKELIDSDLAIDEFYEKKFNERCPYDEAYELSIEVNTLYYILTDKNIAKDKVKDLIIDNQETILKIHNEYQNWLQDNNEPSNLNKFEEMVSQYIENNEFKLNEKSKHKHKI